MIIHKIREYNNLIVIIRFYGYNSICQYLTKILNTEVYDEKK